MKRLKRRLRRPLHTLTSTDAYALWASHYPPQAHNPLMQIEEQAMRHLLPPLAGLTVLDLACGTGRYTTIASEAGAQTIINLDNSAAMLHRNPHRLRILADLSALPLPAASVDGVICGMALGHLPDITLALTAMARVLRPGGVALLSDFHPCAALSGAQRTFTADDGRVYAVEHHIHLYSAYVNAAHDAGLVIDAAAEPALNGGPVVIVYRMRKRL